MNQIATKNDKIDYCDYNNKFLMGLGTLRSVFIVLLKVNTGDSRETFRYLERLLLREYMFVDDTLSFMKTIVELEEFLDEYHLYRENNQIEAFEEKAGSIIDKIIVQMRKYLLEILPEDDNIFEQLPPTEIDSW
jgi:hypothetical protein